MSDLPIEVLDVLAEYDLRAYRAQPLPGGWDVHAENWLIQSDVGSVVLRRDRSITPASADWLAAVLDCASREGVPVSTPLRTRDGRAGAALGDHALTVTPYVEGRTVDRDQPKEVAAAAGALARLHAALRGLERPRPDRSLWHPALWPGDADPAPLRDRELDRFEIGFAEDARFFETVIHGDYWADNLIWSHGRIVAVIDWSEARHDKAVRELARATWEYGHGPDEHQLDIERARAFLAAYREAAGDPEPDIAEVLVPLMRSELRLNARYAYWQAEREDDQVERKYADGLARAFARLRALESALLLR
jgi:Ser/Thr protein kinase RdoA (MazF antagonist)